jgi:hypothetical protein
MPLLLNKYKYFIDIPHGFSKEETIIPALSRTGLEALACGTKVLSPFYGELRELPQEHRLETVIRRLAEIVESIF